MRFSRLIALLLAAFSMPGIAAETGSGAPLAQRATNTQYILFNRAPGQGMNQVVPESLGRKQVEDVLAQFPNRPGSRVQTGLSYIFSCFRTPPETTLRALKTFLDAATQTDTPVLVQIDTEHWWEARPGLWNSWDPARPGCDAANREIVVRRLVPVVLAWHAQLPPEKKHLLIGIRLGHETSIGVNAYHYPSGNEPLSQPAAKDPTGLLNTGDVLARGVAQIGYAALKTSGVRTNGTPTEAELRDVAQHYLAMLCREAALAGVPRERLFAHGAGWNGRRLAA